MLQAAAVIAAGEIPAAPVVGVMAFGLVVAIVGHISRNNALAGLGIAVLFGATATMVLLAYLEFQGGESFDPRPTDPALPRGVYP